MNFEELQILGIIASYKGWCHRGSVSIAHELKLDAGDVREVMRKLITEQILEEDLHKIYPKVRPVKITQLGMAARAKAAKELFPDIFKALLSRR